MRILLLSDRIPLEHAGGAEKVAWNLARGLRDAAHEVHIISATEKAPYHEYRSGIAVHYLHARYPMRFHGWLSVYNPQTIRPLRRLFAEIRPDVVNAHNIHRDLSYASIALAHRMGFPVVFTSHDVMPFAYSKLTHFVDPAQDGVESPAAYRLPPFYNLRQMRFRYNPLRNILIRRILRQHTAVRTCVSEAHRQALEANDLPPFRVVYNGVDPASLEASAPVIQALRKRLALADRRVILFGGRITPHKGSAQLLAALAEVVKSVPEALLLVLTARALDRHFVRPEYQQLCTQHVCTGGWLAGEDLAAAYQLADVVVAPSIIMDTSSMVCLEGMAAARPVIATCYGGAPELVVDGETGYVINPFDTETFSERLARLLRDSALRQRMGEAGRRRLVAHFSLDTQVENMLVAYQDAMRAG